eukprot:TRINITY_DN4320_c0_g1_i1.p2 TRINITY_DN4320_c0_g1~~TRINITY_DN4320_c0_g1_i1.p2  ORF type:complete len:152 (+),score=48.08 TRINITY_DN4320_c0_g1_i1:79-534(+)
MAMAGKLGKPAMPLLLGKAPTVHRTSYNQTPLPGAFRKTRPVGGGGTYSDCPYPYVKLATNPIPFTVLPWRWVVIQVLALISIAAIPSKFLLMPRDAWTFWSLNEMFRRRRERAERLEMDCLGIDEDDVDPKLVDEMDRLYTKGRSNTMFG